MTEPQFNNALVNHRLLLDTIKQLDPLSLHYRVELKPDQMMALAQEMEALRVIHTSTRMIERLNGALPVCHGEGEALEGRQFHTFWFGREYSRVLYVDVIKNYHTKEPPVTWSTLKTRMKHIASVYHCDEHSVEEDGTFMRIRFWWD